MCTDVFKTSSLRNPPLLPGFQVRGGNSDLCFFVLSYSGVWYMSSLVPRPPFNTARGKGGLVNIVQHFCRSTEFRRDNLIG